MPARVEEMLDRMDEELQPALQKMKEQSYTVAPVVGTLLKPASAIAFVLAFWRLGADLNWTQEFVIADGLFSRWQVWMAMAIALQVTASHLNRFGRPRSGAR